MKTILIVLMLILHLKIDASNQRMEDLYKYIIKDAYKESLKKRYLSEQDTMNIIWCMYSLDKNCITYDIQLDNDMIQFKMPKLDENHLSTYVYKLNIPELEGQFISISIVPYSVTYNNANKSINYIYAYTIVYKFKYDKKKSKYVFDLKEEKAL